MTLNGVMAIILRYFAEFGSFRGQLYVKVVVLFAVVELLVKVQRVSTPCTVRTTIEQLYLETPDL